MNALKEEEKQEVLKKTAIISLSTISMIIKMIEVSSKRGAYMATELSTVGSMYDHLVKGMNQIVDQYKAEKATNTPKEEEEKKEMEVIEEEKKT